MPSQSVLINALCLRPPDVEALVQGRVVAAISQTFLSPGKTFALCPIVRSFNSHPELAIEEYYNERFLAIAQMVSDRIKDTDPQITAWARVESCKIYKKPDDIEALSKASIWQYATLQKIINEAHKLFLTCLRVYSIEQPITVPRKKLNSVANGTFLNLSPVLTVSDTRLVLTDTQFIKQQQHLSNLEPAPHFELELLQTEIFKFMPVNQDAMFFCQYLNTFLGWPTSHVNLISDFDWIQTISSLANRTLEEEPKSNYQAGTDFENIVRQSLNFLGFKVEEAYKGKAGGLDLYCSQPYPIAIECKSGKGISDRSVEELDRIGKRHLKDKYLSSVRLIIGPGKPSRQLQESALTSKVCIMNAQNLQSLVELHKKYPGSINLIELKSYFVAGDSNQKLQEYIEEIKKRIEFRSALIKILKKTCEKARKDDLDVPSLHSAYCNSEYYRGFSFIEENELRDILIELTSPLTGYLGRRKGEDGSDRFYFLRELEVDNL